MHFMLIVLKEFLEFNTQIVYKQILNQRMGPDNYVKTTRTLVYLHLNLHSTFDLTFIPHQRVYIL